MSKKSSLTDMFSEPEQPPASREPSPFDGIEITYMAVGQIPFEMDTARIAGDIETRLNEEMPYITGRAYEQYMFEPQPPMKVVSLILDQPANLSSIIDIFMTAIKDEAAVKSIDPASINLQIKMDAGEPVRETIAKARRPQP